jgi:hypothetical protein
MSMPSRIGIILIAALALIDAFILASGARDAASAIETHALADTSASTPATHETLLSTALRQINLAMKPMCKEDKSTGA